MPRVVFTPSGLEGTVAPGTTVLDAGRQLGVDVDSVCGGRGICGRCQINPSVGSFAKWNIESDAAALTEPGETEANYRGRRPLEEGRRLGCAAHIDGDVVIDVPPDSQVHRQVVRKSVDLTGVVIDPLVRPIYLEIPKAELGVGESASDMILDALDAAATSPTHPRVEDEGATDRPATVVSPSVLPHLHRALDKGEGAVTVAVRRSRAGHATSTPDTVVAIWPGYVGELYGIAVDIGSTTIAGHLCDLATGEVVASSGRMNPQIRYGEDLMSRVSYVMMNAGGEVELTTAVRTALGELAAELFDEADVAVDRCLDIVLVGNPIMHHLVLGIDPTPLGQAPFTLATAEAVHRTARDLDLDIPNASVYVAPCIAGHVGADTAAAILAEGPHRGENWQLLVDVGTNAEIVLGTERVQFAASSPTGPAFEGAQISCGQRATSGAIERVRIDRTTLDPKIKVIGSDLWSDDPGFAADTANLAISGVCGSGIIEVVGEMFLSGIILTDGTIDGSLAASNPRIVEDGRTFGYVLWEGHDGAAPLMITQNDVRAIQLAKAALRAGIDLLIERAADLDPASVGPDGLTVGDIRLAGAFGSHIDPLYALVLGLVPDCPVAGVRGVGNSAGAGAARALLSGELRDEIESATRSVTKIETATEPRFQELFVDAMGFPHASVPTPHLAAEIALPEPTTTPSAESERGGRRRRRRKPRADESMSR